MEATDDELLAQFAALSAEDHTNPALQNIPKPATKKRRWQDSLLMRVTSPNVITEAVFAVALRRSWNVHPDTVVEGLGNNYFLVQFQVQMEMLRISAKGIWKLSKGDMVVTRQAKGPEDLVNPSIDVADVWVELHGIPPDSWDADTIKSLMDGVGEALTEVTTFFHINKRVYRQKLRVKITEPLKPKVPLRHTPQGIEWVYVVYENMGNICKFCARVGHDHTICPARYRLMQMKDLEQYKAQIGGKPIPETQVGRWIADRTMLPREENHGLGQNCPTHSSGSSNSKSGREEKSKPRVDRKQKRTAEVDERRMNVLCLEGGMSNQNESEGESHLNCKRARETNPNSSPKSQ